MLLIIFALCQDRQVASIGYSFDRDSENAGPYLDPLHPRAAYAEAMLDLVDAILESDPDYVSRLKKHYAQVKAAIADPNAQKVLKEWRQEEQELTKTDPLQVKMAEFKASLDDISRDSEKPKRRRKRGRRRRRKAGD